ncbi:hypothetical protein D3C73_1117220 [compost metagenome]
MISFLPEVKPPEAPPNALPKVPVMISTRSITLKSSCVPRPVAPINPVQCDSSIITSAWYLSARSQIWSNGATDPSIENAPSVTMILCRAPDAACNCASRSAISAFL